MIVNASRYVTEKEVAAIYGRSISWVQKIRKQDKQFPYHKLNGRVYFNEIEVDNWFKDNLKPM